MCYVGPSREQMCTLILEAETYAFVLKVNENI